MVKFKTYTHFNTMEGAILLDQPCKLVQNQIGSYVTLKTKNPLFGGISNMMIGDLGRPTARMKYQ